VKNNGGAVAAGPPLERVEISTHEVNKMRRRIRENVFLFIDISIGEGEPYKWMI